MRAVDLSEARPWPAGDEASEMVSRFDGQMAEVRLLLSARQVAQLEQLACQDGRTVGQVLRRLIRDSLSLSANPARPGDGRL